MLGPHQISPWLFVIIIISVEIVADSGRDGKLYVAVDGYEVYVGRYVTRSVSAAETMNS
jgi:hypothetical protein